MGSKYTTFQRIELKFLPNNTFELVFTRLNMKT